MRRMCLPLKRAADTRFRGACHEHRTPKVDNRNYRFSTVPSTDLHSLSLSLKSDANYPSRPSTHLASWKPAGPSQTAEQYPVTQALFPPITFTWKTCRPCAATHSYLPLRIRTHQWTTARAGADRVSTVSVARSGIIQGDA
ncbi:hypothetical protein MTO96_021564 [Rhipicephalus appendiculatus]